MADALDLKQLDALANTPLTVTVGGRVRHAADGTPQEIPQRTIHVSEIEVPEFASMLRACEPVIGMLMELDMRAAMLRDPEAAINVIRVGARLSQAEIDLLSLDELLKLGSAVLQVNVDFFVHRLAPVFTEVSQKVAALMAGSTPLPDLSGQGSPPTS